MAACTSLLASTVVARWPCIHLHIKSPSGPVMLKLFTVEELVWLGTTMEG